MSDEEKKYRGRRIPHIAIEMYKESLFHYLYDSGNNQALLNITGYDHDKFNKLTHKAVSKFGNYTFDHVDGIIREKEKSIFLVGRAYLDAAVSRLGLILS